MVDDKPTVEFASDPEADESNYTVSAADIRKAVVSTTDWTVQVIISQLEQGNILLTPRFQRRDAWTRPRKSLFIESLMLGLPVPPIVLAEQRGSRNKFIVLDGKQRLLSLLQFAGGSTSKNNAFALTGLKVRDDLNGKKYKDLESNIMLGDDLVSFHNETIRSVVIRNWPNTDFLHTVFLRLNTGSVPLSTQELRQAVFPGEFSDFADVAAGDSKAIQHLLGLTEPDFRMRDVELLVRFLSFSFKIDEYAGNLKLFLDNSCRYFNSTWEENEVAIRERTAEFDRAVEAGQLIFGDNAVGRKWTEEGLQTRLNRAVLDVIVHYLAIPEVRDASLSKKVAVLEQFKDICIYDSIFRESIESTTKSLGATYERYRRWGERLESVLDVEVGLPVFADNRIIIPNAPSVI